MSKNLMIVESPAKAKTIEKFLGKDFTVTSCYGHIRDLSKGDAAIDVENNYLPNYVVPTDKKSVVKELKDLAKKAETVWLATDEDREGEAISWHLCEVLGLNLEETKRIVFHEITKPAILKAVGSPRNINQDLVNAQQARRVLDRLVGFKISPILWRKITRSGSLSAGRVQSVAVRLVVEREREIRNFESEDFYKVVAAFKLKDDTGKDVVMKADLPRRLKSQAAAEEFLESCKGATFTIKDIQLKPVKKTPPPPFTTSTLQQDASRKLGFSVSRTMIVAQKLYESGLITYMRTDSTNLSELARATAAEQITKSFGEEYTFPRVFKTKASGAQEAHEAIRPSYFEKSEAGSNDDQKRLYSLIWKRAVASQMSDAKLERTNAKIEVSTNGEVLSAKGEVLKFDGFLKLYRESAIDEESEEDKSDMLPPISVGQTLDLKTARATQRFTRPPARYNEARLVRKLEELGIGRPSTYAPTISTIQNRNYAVKESREGALRKYVELVLFGEGEAEGNVVKPIEKQETTGAEKNKLFPTDIGRVVNDFLLKYFTNIFEYNFTAEIEKQFDEIASGNRVWNNVIDEFFQPFFKVVEHTMENAERESGERPLGNHPKSGKPIIARLGKFGPMVQIGTVDDEEKPKFAKLRAPLSIDTITLEQALELFKLPKILGAYEELEVKVNEGRYGPYVMHNKKFYSIDKEKDPMTVTLAEAIQLIDIKREEEKKKIIIDFEGEDIQVLNGRYGPYIKAGKKNVKIPKDKEPAELTLEECKELIEKAPEKKKRGRSKKAK